MIFHTANFDGDLWPTLHYVGIAFNTSIIFRS